MSFIQVNFVDQKGVFTVGAVLGIMLLFLLALPNNNCVSENIFFFRNYKPGSWPAFKTNFSALSFTSESQSLASPTITAVDKAIHLEKLKVCILSENAKYQKKNSVKLIHHITV